MATADVTYTFTADTKAQASQVNQNFTDLVDFVNTETVQRDGSVAMTGALSLSGDPTATAHAARKAYVDKNDWTPVTMSLSAGTYSNGVSVLGTATITDPGYDIQFYGLASLIGSGTALDYWALYYRYETSVTRGGVIIPIGQTGVNQTLAAALNLQTHSTGSNLVISLCIQRYTGTGNFSFTANDTYQGATIFWRKKP